MNYYNTTGPSGPSSFPSCASTTNQCGCSYGGCMDSNKSNYDANATCDDGSCISWVGGCMTPGSLNYSPTATQDNGSCVAPVSGCQDPNAYNYKSNANVGCSGSSSVTLGTPVSPVNAGSNTIAVSQGLTSSFSGYSNMRGTDWQRQGQALSSGTDWQDVNLNACGGQYSNAIGGTQWQDDDFEGTTWQDEL
jgi:hypothetical protein